MPPKPINKNTLFFGDNLSILREHIETLLASAQVRMPQTYGTFKQAQKVKQNAGVQGGLDLGA